MASVTIPAAHDGRQAFEETVLLDGVNFTLQFSWNNQRNFWTLTLLNSSGDVLVIKKIVADTPLLARYIAMDGFPTGDIIPIDTSKLGLDPGLFDLDDRVQLLYYSASDFL